MGEKKNLPNFFEFIYTSYLGERGILYEQQMTIYIKLLKHLIVFYKSSCLKLNFTSLNKQLEVNKREILIHKVSFTYGGNFWILIYINSIYKIIIYAFDL